MVGIADGAFSGLTLQVGELIFPETIRFIGERAFSHTYVKKITFSENSAIESIGDDAFSDCFLLKSVTFPSSLKELGERAFFNDDALFEVVFGERSSLTEIKKETFRDCQSLSEITIPSSVVEIGEKAFFGSTIRFLNFGQGSRLKTIRPLAFDGYLRQVYVPKTLAEYEGAFKGPVAPENHTYFFFEGAKRADFYEKSGLIKYFTEVKEIIEVNNVVTTVNSDDMRYAIKKDGAALYDVGFTHLEKDVTIPDSVYDKPVTEIYSGAFDLVGIVNVLTLPDTVSDLGEFALSAKFKEVRLPETLAALEDYRLALSADVLKLPLSVKRVEADAFGLCNIKYLHLHSEIEYFDKDALLNAGFMTTIVFDEETPPENFPYGWEHGLKVVYSFEKLKRSDGFLYDETEDGIILVKYDGKETRVIVPEEIDGKKVVRISDRCFLDYEMYNGQEIVVTGQIEIENGAVSGGWGQVRTLIVMGGGEYTYDVFDIRVRESSSIVKEE
ncbi:MAG: leucine-rich repeat protein [Clostridia bacterium]|nr:leucine-rich repeat protein [Clostridia bacterium]